MQSLPVNFRISNLLNRHLLFNLILFLFSSFQFINSLFRRNVHLIAQVWKLHRCENSIAVFLYSYFEKCSLKSRMVLWVVLSSLFFKETQWKNGTSGHWRVLQVLNESNKCNRFDSYSVGKSVVIILHDYCLSGLPYTFFQRSFSE